MPNCPTAFLPAIKRVLFPANFGRKLTSAEVAQPERLRKILASGLIDLRVDRFHQAIISLVDPDAFRPCLPLCHSAFVLFPAVQGIYRLFEVAKSSAYETNTHSGHIYHRCHNSMASDQHCPISTVRSVLSDQYGVSEATGMKGPRGFRGGGAGLVAVFVLNPAVWMPWAGFRRI